MTEPAPSKRGAGQHFGRLGEKRDLAGRDDQDRKLRALEPERARERLGRGWLACSESLTPCIQGGEFHVYLADQDLTLDVVPFQDSIIRIGQNASETATADKAAFLIDAKDYFRRLHQVLRRARNTIWIVGWDFNPNIRLRPETDETLGGLLRSAVEANPELQVRILIWAMGPIYSGKTLKFFRKMPWNDHPRISLHFDLKHPVRACHHQKIVCVDDAIAFLGGMDVTARRWDDRQHAVENDLRVSPEGVPYEPVHDIQAMVSGKAARMIGDIARKRWQRATGEIHQPLDNGEVDWPLDLPPSLEKCRAAVALTEPWNWNRKGRREAIRLTHDALMSARRHIYIETQYLASFNVAKTLARRLQEPDGPEVVAIVTRRSHGFLEKIMMGNNRDRLIRRLKRADRFGRLRVMYPVVPNGKGGEHEVLVHSKLIVVDDHFVRIGSSNLNYRSEGLDTECDLALEGVTAEQRLAIVQLRNDLLAEHLDADIDEVGTMIERHGSMIVAIDTLNTRTRGLRPFIVDVERGETSSIPGTGLIDPREPFWPLQSIPAQFGAMASWLRGALSFSSGCRTRK